MAFIVGPTPGTNFTLSNGATVRHAFGWPDAPAGRGNVLIFAMPPNIRSHNNRVVSYNNGVEQHGAFVVYTIDLRCEDVTGTHIGTAYQIGGGGLV